MVKIIVLKVNVFVRLSMLYRIQIANLCKLLVNIIKIIAFTSLFICICSGGIN